MKKIWILVIALLLVLGLSPGVLRADGMGTQAELGDLNNDGSVDVVLCVQQSLFEPYNVAPADGYRRNIKIFMNDGTGNFTDETAERLPESRYAVSIKLEDIDADNDLDIIGVRTVGIDCYLNDGMGKFTLKEAPKPTAPPIAKASATPNVGPTPLTVQLSSAGSVDPDGGALTYHWDFGDGAVSDEANPTHVYKYNSEYDSRKDGLFVSDGFLNRYVAVLTVTDAEGKTGSAQTMVIVRQLVQIPDRPPIAKASAVPSVGTTPLTVQLSSAGSVDPDGGTLTYHWDLGDGTTSDEANPVHVYSYNIRRPIQQWQGGLFLSAPASSQQFRAVLTVTDNAGKTGETAKIINVYKYKEDIPPTLNILRQWQGETSNSGEHWGKNLVITAEVEWKLLWVRGVNGNGEKIYEGPPAVDFETEMALYVSAVAPYPGTRSIKITKIIQTETEIVVSVQITKLPSKGNTAAVLAYSYHAVVIAKSSLPVRFVVTGEQNVQVE